MRPLAALAFVLVPLAEIYVLIQVGQVIGAWWTVLLLLAMAVLGGWLVKRELRSAWRALQTALQEGRVPSTEIADTALITLGGALLLAPGFLTDVVGLAILLPVTRPLFRTLVVGFAARRVQAGAMTFAAARAAGPAGQPGGPQRGYQVVAGEVVDDARDPGAPRT